MTDHHDDEDTTTVPDTTVTAPFPRVRRDTTRLDPYGMYDVAEPTRVTPAPPVSSGTASSPDGSSGGPPTWFDTWCVSW